MTTYRRHDHPLVAFKKSPIHGTGGFARVDLRRGKRIIEYIGPRLSTAEGQIELDQNNAYIFTLDEITVIDGSVAWNLARFLNHSCEPNCESGIVRDRLWFYALRAIKAGEERPTITAMASPVTKIVPATVGLRRAWVTGWLRSILPPFANAIPSDPFASASGHTSGEASKVHEEMRSFGPTSDKGRYGISSPAGFSPNGALLSYRDLGLAGGL